MKRVVIGIGLLVAVATLPLLFLEGNHAEAGAAKGSDGLCRNLLAHEESVEALSWMRQSRPGNERTLGEQDPVHSMAIVQELYDSGATKVHAMEIQREPGFGETANILCTELPDDKTKREKLFEIEARKASSEGFDPTPDEGQTYMFMFKFKLGFWQTIARIVGH